MFLHKLALRLGRTVGELRATLSVDELASWIAFNDRSPISDERLDLLFARLNLSVCQAQGAKKKSGAPFELEDFLLWRRKEPPQPGNVLEFMRLRVNPKRIVNRAREG